MDIDPFAYSLEPQTLLTIPFEVETVEVDGFYGALHPGERPPLVTSSGCILGNHGIARGIFPYQKLWNLC